LNTKVSRGSVETGLRCSGIYNRKFAAESQSSGEILKIVQNLAKFTACTAVQAVL